MIDQDGARATPWSEVAGGAREVVLRAAGRHVEDVCRRGRLDLVRLVVPARQDRFAVEGQDPDRLPTRDHIRAEAAQRPQDGVEVGPDADARVERDHDRRGRLANLEDIVRPWLHAGRVDDGARTLSRLERHRDVGAISGMEQHLDPDVGVAGDDGSQGSLVPGNRDRQPIDVVAEVDATRRHRIDGDRPWSLSGVVVRVVGDALGPGGGGLQRPGPFAQAPLPDDRAVGVRGHGLAHAQ